jgi:LacI family transcriptional regulator
MLLHFTIANHDVVPFLNCCVLYTFSNNCKERVTTQFAFDQFNSYQLPYVLIDRVTDNQQCIEADHYKL